MVSSCDKTNEREDVIAKAQALVRSGGFAKALQPLVAQRTESQRADRAPELRTYLEHTIKPELVRLGFDCTLHENPAAGEHAPFLVARRVEDPKLPTVLSYGHGDVVHGQAGEWSDGRNPFELQHDGDRLYGRGTADNKGQHLINLMALDTVLQSRGTLGFNVTFLFEMGEETGSPGLEAFCSNNRDVLAADVLLASDGPRLRADVPTVFLGARGALNFELAVTLRPRGQHSGNFGGLLTDPVQVLTHALATITDRRGQIKVPGWRPNSLTKDVRDTLARLPEPPSDADWGETGLSAAERAYGWNSFAVLALEAGSPEAPQNAIAGHARAFCQLRFVVGTSPDRILPDLRAHLDEHGFEMVDILSEGGVFFPATRSASDNPWVTQVVESIMRTAGPPDILPNLAGSLPNHCFSEILGLPTVWIPHSYSGCNQHAPDEHVLLSVCENALGIMAGLFWDLGEHA